MIAPGPAVVANFILVCSVMCRLIRDLPDDSIVVDYNDDLAKAVSDSATHREVFEVEGSCVVPVSWDSQQHMYIMRRRQV